MVLRSQAFEDHAPFAGAPANPPETSPCLKNKSRHTWKGTRTSIETYTTERSHQAVAERRKIALLWLRVKPSSSGHPRLPPLGSGRLGRLFGLRGTGWWRGGFGHVAVLDLRLALELLIVFVFHGLANALRARFEVEGVVRDGVRREPILAVDLLAIGLEFGELIIFVPLQQTNAASVSLDDLQVFIVDPNLPLEVPLTGLKLLGLYGE